MAQIIPLVAQLGSANTGLNLGYTVLNLDRTVYAAFSVTGVGESNVPGTYYVSGGVTLPDAGGYIVVGESGSDMVEVAVDAAPPTTAENASQVRTELTTELARIDAATSTRLATAGYTAPPSAATVASQVDVTLSAAHGSGPWGGSGAGTGTYSDTVTDGADPLDNVLVQLSTDAAGTNMAYRTYSAADGSFTLRPDPGTYYVWLELAGYSFTQGAQVVVT